tara:strand:- start:219 stop:1415 length:1197 start_codon:yes stop_codon:yes gene_type:complete
MTLISNINKKNNQNLINYLEKQIISSKDRFGLNNRELKEIKKDFLKSNVLIVGAAGSIGSEFVKRMYDFNFSKLFLLDKNENDLTDLNRYLVRSKKRSKVNLTDYICTDINTFSLSNFIKENEVSHYLNFAAVKHVRSEENFHSLKYMIETNSKNFLWNINPNNKLKKIFSVSTDKSVNPQSFLGFSKKLMEAKMYNFKKKNKKIFVSSARFANVSFSNGSILKLIIEKLGSKDKIGIPVHINRYFITHRESISLCLKSLLKENDNHVILPEEKVLKKQYSILYLLKKILKLLKISYSIPKHKKYILIKKFGQKIYLVKKSIIGQKNFEEIIEESENLKKNKNDNSTIKTDLRDEYGYEKVIKKLNRCNNLIELKKIIQIYLKLSNQSNKRIQLSKSI